MKKVIIIPVVVGASDAISTGFEKYVVGNEVEIKLVIRTFPKNSHIADSKDFETGTWMLKKTQHYKYQYHFGYSVRPLRTSYCPLSQK